jgi:transcriptional regulator with XRE-family HTH domain
VADHPDLQALGREVRVAREAHGLSQERVAERSGLHRNYIGGVERGERNISAKALLALARALGMTASELLGRAGL